MIESIKKVTPESLVKITGADESHSCGERLKIAKLFPDLVNGNHSIAPILGDMDSFLRVPLSKGYRYDVLGKRQTQSGSVIIGTELQYYQSSPLDKSEPPEAAVYMHLYTDEGAILVRWGGPAGHDLNDFYMNFIGHGISFRSHKPELSLGDGKNITLSEPESIVPGMYNDKKSQVTVRNHQYEKEKRLFTISFSGFPLCDSDGTLSLPTAIEAPDII